MGDELKAGQPFGTIEAVKTVSDVYMPVDGRILEVNPLIGDSPETINKDPYGDGWLIKIEATGSPENLMDAGAYSEMVGSGAAH
jgi:glycine cleavage system H protein